MHQPARKLSLIPALICASLFIACNAQHQTVYTDFETTDSLPPQWAVINESGAFRVRTVEGVASSGRRSLLLERHTVGGVHSALAVSQIPVDFNGNQVEVSGYIKTENAQAGLFGLYLKVEGDPAWTQTEVMRDAKAGGTADWKKFTLTASLKKGARDIYLGVYHAGSGKVWADDLEVRIDGKPLPAVPRLALSPARQDTAFSMRTGIRLDTLTPVKADNLVRLGKVWGFLKYYHPAVAAGKYNWDAELFRVLPALLHSADRQAANNVMEKWVEGLPPVAPDTAMKGIPPMVKLPPDLGWLADTTLLGSALSGKLDVIRKAKREDAHYYVGLQSTGNASFNNELRYSYISPADDGFRLLALFRYWNYVQYYFPYRHLIGEDWHGVLARFVPVFAKAEDAASYQLAVLQLMTTIQDSHVQLQGNTMAMDRSLGFHRIYADIRHVEGRPTVVRPPVAVQGDALKRGDVILQVNGTPVETLRKWWEPYLPASNDSHRSYAFAAELLRGKDSLFTLEVDRNGQRKTLQLVYGQAASRHPDNRLPLPEKPWKLLPGNIGYMYLRTLRKADIPEMMKQFFSTRGIVIDLRGYPYEMYHHDICSYLTVRAVPFHRSYGASVREPGQFSYLHVKPVGGGNRYPYRGKVIVLVNEETQSRGEFFAMAFKAIPGVTIMGGPTAGTDGTVTDFYLPGGLKTRFTGDGICWPDGTESQRTGIVPDVPVRLTRKGVMEGTDELLEAALQRMQP